MGSGCRRLEIIATSFAAFSRKRLHAPSAAVTPPPSASEFIGLAAMIFVGHACACLGFSLLLTRHVDWTLLHAAAFVAGLPFRGFWEPSVLDGTQWIGVFLTTVCAALLMYSIAKRSKAGLVAMGVAMLAYGASSFFLIAMIA